MLHDRDYMRDPRDARRFRWQEVLWPDAVTLLVIVNVVVFLAQHVFLIGAERAFVDGEPGVKPWGGLSIPALAEGRVWTVFTHMFVHGGLLHLLGNCLLIFFAGRAVQSLLGPRNFLLIYFMSGVIGAALELATGWISGVPVEIIGASGCGSGVFVALAVMLPQEVVTALVYFVIPVRIKLWNLARIMLGCVAGVRTAAVHLAAELERRGGPFRASRRRSGRLVHRALARLWRTAAHLRQAVDGAPAPGPGS